jgi:outer membrane protein OmpA-like peptidoglycan-associated protein
MKTTPIKQEAGITGHPPQFKMNQTHVSNLVLLLLGLFVAATSVQAQRETFEASRIIKSTELALQMKAPPAAGSPGKALTRKGADSKGRPVAVQATTQMVSFKNIFFELDSTQLRDRDSELQLLEIASFLKLPAFAKARFLIEGHTCDLGEGHYNLKLSAARAEAVRSFLIHQGIAPERLVVIGLGETEPDYKITSQDGAGSVELKRSHNRRVVLRALPPRPSRD